MNIANINLIINELLLNKNIIIKESSFMIHNNYGCPTYISLAYYENGSLFNTGLSISSSWDDRSIALKLANRIFPESRVIT